MIPSVARVEQETYGGKGHGGWRGGGGGGRNGVIRRWKGRCDTTAAAGTTRDRRLNNGRQVREI